MTQLMKVCGCHSNNAVGVKSVQESQGRHFVSTEVRRQSEVFKMEINEPSLVQREAISTKNFSFNTLVFEVS